MEQIGYGEHIAETVKNIPYEAAIQTENIAAQLAETFALPYEQAKALTNVKLKRMADKGEIERLQKGVYCQVKQTIFGKVTPSIEQVMKKTLTEQNGAKIGYESGAFLMNRLGLTTLIPRNMEITTNRYGAKLPKDCHIKLKKPAVPITDDNWKYLQFIDLTMALADAHIDAEKPELLLTGYAKRQELDGLALLFTARKHYSAKVILPLIDLLMEVNNELTSG
ncbi:type IV toxin-antitoxin system AbiEi family antitoxin domain-containing protein [Pelotomaculum terephthalicicum JT]|jgi:hypothetical protein|uniref:DUF6088 family protein n=1 Tax=Clostridia TaxID=186801 RepID=UPI00037E7439|nr:MULTISPECIES: DUF6088 family protein [Clostridia]MCK9342031.1 type IV toxin-antitoxin system AbiEi family antitoxin domain-containing protein [Synergistaceae bacterium]MCG9966946.1 type IV toxin-antitoxin system AbiEi family antitoxin domain-containing protein [Pelotomaculum terephthalicicum JT]MCK9435697.1 type IV toxin-antitoxin system AbiEi family antitoxin domain-containing protein [Synergistaceae bacterium]MCQ5125085.1 type IV toxin-antitoxin system AbiEi family antitoxin domain-contain